MSRRIVSQKENYVTLPTYLEIKEIIKPEFADIIRSFLYDYEAKDVRTFLKALAGNYENVIMDLDKNRTSKRETVSQQMQAKVNTSKNYDIYMKDYVSTQVSDSDLVSIYAHIKGLKSYKFVFSSRKKERLYVYDSESLSLPDIKPLFEDKIKGSNCAIQINDMPLHFVVECALKGYNVDEALAKGFPFTGDYQGISLTAMMASIVDAKFDFDPKKPGHSLQAFAEGGAKFRMPVFGGVEITMSPIAFHRGVDRMGLTSVGSISKAFWIDKGLDPSLTALQIMHHFHRFLDAGKTDTYAFYNVSFVEEIYKSSSSEVDQVNRIRLANMKRVQLLAVPGCPGFILKMTDKPIGCMNTFLLFSSYKQTYLKIHYLYSLASFYKPIDYSWFLDAFCVSIGLNQLRPILASVFELFELTIIKDIQVQKRVDKLSTRIQGALKSVISMLSVLETMETPEIKIINIDTFGFTDDVDTIKGKSEIMGRVLPSVNKNDIRNRESIKEELSEDTIKYRAERRAARMGKKPDEEVDKHEQDKKVDDSSGLDKVPDDKNENKNVPPINDEKKLPSLGSVNKNEPIDYGEKSYRSYKEQYHTDDNFETDVFSNKNKQSETVGRYNQSLDEHEPNELHEDSGDDNKHDSDDKSDGYEAITNIFGNY